MDVAVRSGHEDDALAIKVLLSCHIRTCLVPAWEHIGILSKRSIPLPHSAHQSTTFVSSQAGWLEEFIDFMHNNAGSCLQSEDAQAMIRPSA